jgi:hypothetical protein
MTICQCVESWFERLGRAARSGGKAVAGRLRGEREGSGTTRFAEAMRSMTGRTVMIYGAGSFGKEMYHVLAENGVAVEAFLDRDAGRIGALFGVPVMRADDPRIDPSLRQNGLVLLSIVTGRAERQEIVRLLHDCAFNDVLEAQALRCLLVFADGADGVDPGRDYVECHRAAITKAASLFADEESRECYRRAVEAHVTRDYRDCRSVRWPSSIPPGHLPSQGLQPLRRLRRLYRRYARSARPQPGPCGNRRLLRADRNNYGRLVRRIDGLRGSFAGSFPTRSRGIGQDGGCALSG